jgi:iron(III) transport system substrate-binding protein
MTKLRCATLLVAGLLAAMPLRAADTELNIYSARHYQTDQRFYDDFTQQTGIRINLIEGSDSALMERLSSEGANSPADVLILVDAARLWKAEEAGLFQPVKSDVLAERIPAHLRSIDEGDGSKWFGVSRRARIIIYNPDKVDGNKVRNYADLADPSLKGLVCTRSGTHPYMLSLIGAMVEHMGAERAEQWAAGVVANFARTPRGGDTDQIKATAAGECGVALANSYYFARMMRSTKDVDRQIVEKVKAVWPDQDGHGTHMNITGIGVLKHAPHREAAVRFIEYMTSEQAQRFLAGGNNEWPAVESVRIDNPALEALGPFKPDPLPIGRIGKAQLEAARIVDRVGWR